MSILHVQNRMCVSLFQMHDHSFERICTKFGLWHPYTLRIVMGG